MSARALDGVRVVDLGTITAGAATSVVLADFGADVVKVEWPGQIDPFRSWTQIASGQAADINSSPPFHTVNRNKRSVGINLKSEAGRAALLSLVADADIVVENFRRGVLERLGLSFDVLRGANPRVVLLSLTSQGVSGPVARYGSFGSTLDALGGLMSITGYGPDEPIWSSNNVNYPDQLVSFLAPGVAMAALREARSSGQAVWVDFSQRESVSFAMGEYFLDYAATGTAPTPCGNVDRNAVVSDVFRSRTLERWVAVTVRESNRGAVERLVGLRDQYPLRDAIAEWVGAREAGEAELLLRQAGVAASVVRSAVDVLEDDQLAALDFFQPVDSHLGRTRQRGFAARLSATPGQIRRIAPNLGDHTVEVLVNSGYSIERVRQLNAEGAIFDAKAASEVEEIVR